MVMRWFFILVCFPVLTFFSVPAWGSENCVTQFNGTCRDTCGPTEEAADGAFIDCAEKQECCIVRVVPHKPVSTSGETKKSDAQKKGPRPE